jgi:hypothetical protein
MKHIINIRPSEGQAVCFTYKELKEILNKFTDEELNQTVLCTSDIKKGHIIGLSVQKVTEDSYGRNLVARSDIESGNVEFIDGFPKKYYLDREIRIKKGTIFILNHTDF